MKKCFFFNLWNLWKYCILFSLGPKRILIFTSITNFLLKHVTWKILVRCLWGIVGMFSNFLSLFKAHCWFLSIKARCWFPPEVASSETKYVLLEWKIIANYDLRDEGIIKTRSATDDFESTKVEKGEVEKAKFIRLRIPLCPTRRLSTSPFWKMRLSVNGTSIIYSGLNLKLRVNFGFLRRALGRNETFLHCVLPLAKVTFIPLQIPNVKSPNCYLNYQRASTTAKLVL